MLLKGVYHYEYMDDWENFNGTSLPEKEDFYSHLYMEDIADTDSFISRISMASSFEKDESTISSLNTWKIMIRLKNLQYLDLNKLHGGAMSQKLPVNKFKLIKDFIKIL